MMPPTPLADKLSITPFQPAEQAQAKELILAGLSERWDSLDRRKNGDLDDIAASYAGGTFLVAKIGSLLVGTGALIPEEEGIARIVRMSVAEQHRGQGIGRLIFQALRDEATAKAYRQIVLETTATWQDAIHFYEKMGFRRTECREGDQHFALEL